MDPITIMLTVVSIISVGEVAGMAWTAHKYRATVAAIPTMARDAAMAMLTDPAMKIKFQEMLCDQSMFEAVSTSLWENFKNLISSKMSGAAGKQTQERNELAGLLQQDMNPLLSLLPDGKFKEKIMKNPQLLSIGLQVLGPLLQSVMTGGGQGGGGSYGR
jgi:hypothetical protein